MFPEENALERLAGDVAREIVHDHDVGHTLELAGHPGVDPLHEPAHADGARPSEDGPPRPASPPTAGPRLRRPSPHAPPGVGPQPPRCPAARRSRLPEMIISSFR